tara:strand:- start:1167 stop:1628 length:462 start_codon:yes stop_codon:yes gene_type:complete
MVFPNKPFYVVAQGFGLEREGSGIGLNPNFAKRFYDRKITQENVDDLNCMGKRIVRKILDLEEKSSIDEPYFFLRDNEENLTLLLQWCSVSGKGRDLVIDGEKLNRIRTWDEFTMNSLIEYRYHNVNTFVQATALFTIWNEWATIAYEIIKED